MFILSPQITEARVLRLRGLPLRLRLGDRFIGIEPGIAEVARQIERFPIRAHGGVEHSLQIVLRPKLEVVGGEFRLCGEAHIFQVGGAGLCRERDSL